MNRCLAAAAMLSTLCIGTANAGPAIYRCGNSYSHLPCTGARTLDAVDPPGSAERAQAERRAEEDRRLAVQMEQARLRDEARLRPALAAGFDSRAAAAPPPPPVVVLAQPHRSRKGAGAADARAARERSKRDDAFVATVPREPRR